MRQVSVGLSLLLLISSLYTVAFGVNREGLGTLATSPFIYTGTKDSTVNSPQEPLHSSTVDIINPQPGQVANYSHSLYYPNGTGWTGWWNMSYNRYVQPHIINTTHVIVRPLSPNGTFWCTVDTTSRWITDTDPDFWWNQTWYVLWVETDVMVGSTVNWWTTTAEIIGSKILYVAGNYIDCWIANSTYSELSYYDKKSGLLVMYEYLVPDGFYVDMVLNTTNIPIGEKLSTAVYFNLNPNPASVGETLTLKGILIDQFSHPLSEETLKVYARPLEGYWRYIASLTTNSYGIFMWRAEIPVQGVFILAVYYPGSETYESSYNLACLQVEKAALMLTVIGPWAGEEMARFMPVLQTFEEATGIDVEYETYRPEDLATILPSMFEENSTLGDVIFMWPWFIQQMGTEGHVLNVTNLIDETDFRPGALDQVKVDRTLYGASYTGKAKPGFWYKKSFFEANNLTEPTTWEGFVTLLETLNATSGIVNPIVSGDGVGWPLSDVTEHFLIAYGGSRLHRDLIAGDVAWNSSTVRTLFADRLVPLLEAGYFSDPVEWTTALDRWWNEEYALYFMGSWITGMVENPEDLGVFPLPEAEGLVFAADYLFIPTYTDHPDEAKLLFQYLASAMAQEIQVAQGGHIATNIRVPLDAYPPVDRRIAEAMEGMEVLPDLDDTIGGEFQTTFWTQLKLLWIDPTKLDEVLDAIEAVAP